MIYDIILNGLTLSICKQKIYNVSYETEQRDKILFAEISEYERKIIKNVVFATF